MAQSQIEQLDPASSTLVLSLDVDLYSRDVLYAAAYVFIDRAYILLDRDADRYMVRMRAKQKMPDETMRAMAGEFENELLAQALREQVGKANQAIIEGITALAISGATAVAESHADGPGLDGFVDDPKGLGAPWQNKEEAPEG